MVRSLYPFEPEQAHCGRVADWVWLIGRKQQLDAFLLSILDRAALQHHAPGLSLSGDAVLRLFTELERELPDRSDPPPAHPDGTEALAAALREACASAPGPRARPIGLLAQILEAAHVFDECLEALPYEERPLAGLLDDAVSLSPDPYWPPLLEVFRKPVLFEGKVLEAALANVPVNPEIVAAVAEAASDPEADLGRLERAAGLDPGLAAALLQAANSARFALRHPISSLGHAISFLGVDATRQVLAAAALRPAFVAPAARALWPHSLEAASLAAGIARRVPDLVPAEAFLAGLFHDFGRLLLLSSPDPALSVYPALLARGCPPVAAELALCGIDHAEIGARVLEGWNIAEPVCLAVRQHHRVRPNNSPLGALLQLCEEIAGSGEDLPSLPRLRDSLRTLRLPAAILADEHVPVPEQLIALQEDS